MARQLDTSTLDAAARHYAGLFLADTGPKNRDWVMAQFHNFTFKDEFDYIVDAMKQRLGRQPLADFNSLAALRFTHRLDSTFEELLASKLAIDPDGEHIPGRIGTTQIGQRVVGKRHKVIETAMGSRALIKDEYWPLYAGEGHERAAGNPFNAADTLPPGSEPLPVGALNTRISNECAILAVDAIVDNLDEGTGAAILRGRTGAQPADPDTAATGTLLFTLTYSATAFGAGVDAGPGGRATANAVTDDSSADATGTVGYCRVSSTNDGATPLDDHLDGEAGTAGADFNFNTVAIVAGATVSLTSHTVTMPEA